jgi:hypothetical protein
VKHAIAALMATVLFVGCASRPRPVTVWLDRGEYPQPIALPAGTVFETPDGERYELKSGGALTNYALFALLMHHYKKLLEDRGSLQPSRPLPGGKEM